MRGRRYIECNTHKSEREARDRDMRERRRLAELERRIEAAKAKSEEAPAR